MLNRFIFGDDPVRPPLLIVHGLFGSARNWGAIAQRMSSDRRVVTVDMRNHGESFRADSQTYADMAGDLAEVIESEGVSFDVLGHSMGGKAAMLLALRRPDLVSRLIVGDIAPVAYDHSNLHLVRAMQQLSLNDLTSRQMADERLRAGVPNDGTRAFLLQSLDLKSVPPHWRLNLEVLGREMDKITGWPGAEAICGRRALFLAGSESSYVLPEYREKIKELFPKAILAKIPGAGHWLHADKPREFEAAVRTFLV